METGQPNSLCISSFRPWGKAYSEEGFRISDVGFRVILRTAAGFAKLSLEPPEIRHPKSDIPLSAILRQYAGCYRKKYTRGISFHTLVSGRRSSLIQGPLGQERHIVQL